MEEAGRDPDEELVGRLATIKQRVFERIGEPGLYPWARQVVETIDERGYPLAICTGTRRENVPGIAGELADRFDFVASEETYEHDKPHPQAFETAAEGLGVEPERCLAVENAPRGIQSARKAGMVVVGVATTLAAGEVAEADLVLADVEDVLDVIPAKPGKPPRT
jgi:HAD superfamily hydrolase (TIGR01509 family)